MKENFGELNLFSREEEMKELCENIINLVHHKMLTDGNLNINEEISDIVLNSIDEIVQNDKFVKISVILTYYENVLINTIDGIWTDVNRYGIKANILLEITDSGYITSVFYQDENNEKINLSKSNFNLRIKRR